MTRYVDKKHGLILGSGNYFFCLDKHAPEGVSNDRDGYNALVWAKPYRFYQGNSVNCMVQTPAEQLLWSGIKSAGSPTYECYRELEWWPRRWLEAHVGPLYDKWDVRTRGQTSEECIFFKRRTDALALCAVIDTMLKGIHYGD